MTGAARRLAFGCGVLVWMVTQAPTASAQKITDIVNGTLSITVPFGTMTPGSSTTPASQTVQFRLRHTQAYRVTASVAFIASPTSPVAGGTTLTSNDIGVGITAIALRPQVLTPRTDTIASGFAYDPATVTAVNGLSPYTGVTGGRATLKDIENSPGMTILSGPQIATNDNLLANNYLTVTITFGVVPQYFTQGSASAVITLAIANQ